MPLLETEIEPAKNLPTKRDEPAVLDVRVVPVAGPAVIALAAPDVSVVIKPEPAEQAVIPRATYRIQLNKSFTFRDATAIIPYLADLGISHVYCSPYFRARAGSMHGYDVVDHNTINPEIGTREDLEEFVRTL